MARVEGATGYLFVFDVVCDDFGGLAFFWVRAVWDGHDVFLLRIAVVVSTRGIED